MYRKVNRKLFVLLLLLFSVVLVSFTMRMIVDYQVPWYSINAGGQRIAADDFVINASVGQPAVSSIEGEGLRLFSGFWVEVGPVDEQRLIFLPLVVR
jgi:hypothetical protein